MTTGEQYPSTSTGRAYRWWGLGVIACLTLAGIGLLAGLLLIVMGEFKFGDSSLLRGLGTAAVFALIPVGILGALVCGHKRSRALFGDAHVSEGAITEVTEVRNSDDNSYYFTLTVSAAVQDGPIIWRRCTAGGDIPRPEIGQILWFRHTTLDPENLDDALVDGIGEHE